MQERSLRCALPWLGLCAVISYTGTAAAAVVARSITTDVTGPVYMTHAGDARLFVVEQAGRIVVLQPPLGASAPLIFLDIRSKVSTGGERGLLSMAFHPEYLQNGFVYVNYTNLSGDTVIERYTRSANVNQAVPGSASALLVIDQPFANHNGGQLQVGPLDGHLYVGMGDGGGAGDTACNAQRTLGGQLLGKMLRLDIRQNPGVAPFHGIPADNPFTIANDPGGLVADSVWALGLRNPWRFSFDRNNGDLYIADVGQNTLEEINHTPAGTPGGRNYGWKVMEGTQCFSSSGCPAGTPSCNDPELTLPVFEYTHDEGCSVTGGYVYRGSRAPELSGAYLYGDYCEGEVRALRQAGAGLWQSASVLDLGTGLTSFGEAVDGSLYASAGNQIFELVSDTPRVPAIGALAWCLGLVLGAAGLAQLGRHRRGKPL